MMPLPYLPPASFGRGSGRSHGSPHTPHLPSFWTHWRCKLRISSNYSLDKYGILLNFFFCFSREKLKSEYHHIFKSMPKQKRISVSIVLARRGYDAGVILMGLSKWYNKTSLKWKFESVKNWLSMWATSVKLCFMWYFTITFLFLQKQFRIIQIEFHFNQQIIKTTSNLTTKHKHVYAKNCHWYFAISLFEFLKKFILRRI